MSKHGKKFKNASSKVDGAKRYPLDEACKLVPETKVGKISKKQLKDIATTKMPDLNTTDLEAAMRTIAGTARSMGIDVEA